MLRFRSRSASANQKYDRNNVRICAPLLRRLNAGTLAFLVFTALAVLPTTHGKDSQTGQSATAKAVKKTIVVDKFSFSPSTITAPVGATVTWTNRDKVTHLIASNGDRFQKSPALKPGQSFSHTFAAAGTYSYFCSIHPSMTGKIIIGSSPE